MKNKKCFKCGKIKPISEFYEHPDMADGHLNKCKQCTKDDTIENRNNNLNHYKQYDKNRAMLPHRVNARKEYNQTKKGKKIRKKTNDRYKSSNPLKYQAHNKISNALRNGKLIRGVCVICGSKNVHAHHPDYSKPLDVIWLCPKHHKEEHKRLEKLKEEGK